jgi:acyl-coenzyme A thioesterase 9
MLDTYANSSGQIRLGTLLMDLDALSGVVAYKHTGEGVTTVTAAVDRITIKNQLKEICDLELSGQVTFATGRSSMEISLQIAKAPSSQADRVKEEDVFITCAFTMVSLDPVSKKPVNVAPLKLETDAERQLYARGEENYNTKKALKHSAITNKAPNAEESKLLHKIWTDSLAYRDAHNPAQKPENVTYMSKATVYSAQIMQPQFRNRHNFMIFGGYLLKQTFELAFTCAAAFSHTKPSFLNLDPSTFENPVPVGSVLYLSAGVTFTEPDSNGGTRIQVIVTTKVRNVEHKQRKNTGTFFYTFHVDNDVQITPQTYDEFMRWVDGRRRAQRVSASLRANEEAGNTQDTIGTTSAERVTE